MANRFRPPELIVVPAEMAANPPVVSTEKHRSSCQRHDDTASKSRPSAGPSGCDCRPKHAHQPNNNSPTSSQNFYPSHDPMLIRLGDEGNSDNMAYYESQEKHLFEVARLKAGDYCFVRRSGGKYTYAKVLTRSQEGKDSTMEFVVNYDGSSKLIPMSHWVQHVRPVRCKSSTCLSSQAAFSTSYRPSHRNSVSVDRRSNVDHTPIAQTSPNRRSSLRASMTAMYPTHPATSRNSSLRASMTDVERSTKAKIRRQSDDAPAIQKPMESRFNNSYKRQSSIQTQHDGSVGLYRRSSTVGMSLRASYMNSDDDFEIDVDEIANESSESESEDDDTDSDSDSASASSGSSSDSEDHERSVEKREIESEQVVASPVRRSSILNERSLLSAFATIRG